MSDVEWVEESNWDTVEEGDRVKLKDDGDIYEFTVLDTEFEPDKGFYGIWLRDRKETFFYCSEGYTLFVERPVVELPTEPGLYISDKGGIYRFLEDDWFYLDDQFNKFCFIRLTNPVPLTKLRPVDEVRAETAKEVVDFIKENLRNSRDYYPGQSIFDGVAAEFGGH